MTNIYTATYTTETTIRTALVFADTREDALALVTAQPDFCFWLEVRRLHPAPGHVIHLTEMDTPIIR